MKKILIFVSCIITLMAMSCNNQNSDNQQASDSSLLQSDSANDLGLPQTWTMTDKGVDILRLGERLIRKPTQKTFYDSVSYYEQELMGGAPSYSLFSEGNFVGSVSVGDTINDIVYEIEINSENVQLSNGIRIGTPVVEAIGRDGVDANIQLGLGEEAIPAVCSEIKFQNIEIVIRTGMCYGDILSYYGGEQYPLEDTNYLSPIAAKEFAPYLKKLESDPNTEYKTIPFSPKYVKDNLKIGGFHIYLSSRMDTDNNTSKEDISMGTSYGGNASSQSSTDWDKVLDEYEGYVDSYIRLIKKVNNGDMSAMAEYAKVLEKYQRLANKLERANDEMTERQMKRYLDITQKMTNAM